MSYNSNQQPDGIPDGFEFRDDGIYALPDPETDGGSPQWLCSPLIVAAQTVDSNGGRCGKFITGTAATGVCHQFVMSSKDIYRVTKVVDQLVDKGFEIRKEKSMQESISKMLLEWKPEKTILLSEKIGWSDETFKTYLLADGSVVGRKNAIYAPTRPVFSLKGVSCCGDLSSWKDTVSLRAIGNPVLITAISLAFAGPLLRINGRNGFGVHFKGLSSTGKTTALTVATSVWGGGDLIKTWRTTSNALEATAAFANDNFLPLDELAEVRPGAAGEACYMLANGQPKIRANSQGHAGKASNWKTVVMSTGEISMAEKLSEAGIISKEGQIVRMMDLKADGRAYGIFDNLDGAIDAASFAKELNESAARVYGHAGPAFVSKLTELSEDMTIFCKSNVKQYTANMLKGVDVSDIPYAPRAAEQFALAALAGEMATRFGLTGWKEFTAIGAASEMFKIWIIGQHNPLSKSEILRRIQEVVATHDARLQQEGSNAIKDKIGWQDKSRVMFDDNGWLEIHGDLDLKAVAQAARGFNLLTAGDGDNLKAKAPNWVPGRPRLYIIQRSVLSST